jgi:AAA15 family ATPase/GTPase
MLIAFKVANFRSIREEQTFSLVASNYEKELVASLIERKLPGMSGQKFLKGAAIYGANASGKSNIVEAVRYLANFVSRSAIGIQPGDSTGAIPFKLDRESKSQPSEFEIAFVAQGTRFIFGFSVTPQRVVEEYLIAFPKGIPQHWYKRVFNEKTNSYVWPKPSTEFRHDKSLEDKTRENSLFLSVAPQFNHLQLTPVFNWFKENLRFVNLSAEGLFNSAFTADLMTNESHRRRILNLLRSADIGIIDAKLTEKKFATAPEAVRKMIAPEYLALLETQLSEHRRIEVKLTHRGDQTDPVPLDLEDEESAGTRRFFSLIGPWIDTLDNGYTVFVDEIETSLHPILVKEVLKLLFCKENNPKGAQVVFTTHNPVLLDNALLRRDQIWFTEKSPAGATHLYPLMDYQPRKDEALAKGYLAGRYGAIPYLPDGLKL